MKFEKKTLLPEPIQAVDPVKSPFADLVKLRAIPGFDDFNSSGPAAGEETARNIVLHPDQADDSEDRTRGPNPVATLKRRDVPGPSLPG